jgi:hypothetical protein
MNLFFDQVEIVEHPFGGRRDAPARIHRQARPIEVPENFLVLAQPCQQTVGARSRNYLVTDRESFSVARQLFDSKQLGSQWRFARARARNRLSGHPVLKAQWQRLHIVFTSGRDSCNLPAGGKLSPLASAASTGGNGADCAMISPGAVAARDQPHNAAASAMITPQLCP